MLDNIKQSLAGGEAYRNFIEKIVREKKVWTLMKNGAHVLADSTGEQKVPFWSAEKDAENCLFGPWADCEVVFIPVFSFVNQVLPQFHIDGIEIMIELKDGYGVYKPVQTVSADIKKEAARQGVSTASLREDAANEIRSNRKYESFIDRILTERQAWLLLKEGASVLTVDEGKYCIPIWSSREGAAGEADGDWKDAVPESIFLKDLLETYLPAHRADYPKVFIDFKEEEGIIVSMRELEKDLKEGAAAKDFDWSALLPGQEKVLKANADMYGFLKGFLERKKVWIICSDEGFPCITDEDGEWFPLWDSEESAGRKCKDCWDAYSPECIGLADFMTNWLEALEKDYDGVGLFTGDDNITEVNFAGLRDAVMLQAEEMGLEEEDVFCENIEYLRSLWNIVRTEKLWILDDGEGAALLERDGESSLPVWPAREDARAECTDEWSKYDPVSISLGDFLDEWLGDLETEGIKVFVTVGDGKGIGMEPAEFREDITEEIKKSNPSSHLLKRTRRTIINSKKTNVLN